MKPLKELQKKIEEAARAKDESLIPAIEHAIDSAIVAGHDVEDIVKCCLDAGYSEGYTRAAISNLLRKRGIRRRADGGGRLADPKAVAVLNHAVTLYGNKEAKRILLGAYRLAAKMDRNRAE